MRRPLVLVLSILTIAAVSPALAQKATVSDKECRQLVDYTASQDPSYKPGVDSRGRPVAGADLPGSQSQIGVPQSLTIDLKVALAGKFGVPSNSPLLDPSVDVGKITVEDNGRRVLYNGQPLGGSEKNALAEACKQQQARQPQTRPMTGPMKLN